MIRRIASISSATIAGQLFQLVAFLALARLLTPADFGPYGAFMAVLALTAAMGAARYELAFGMVPDARQLASLLLIIFGVSMIIGILAGVVTAVIITSGSLLSQNFLHGWPAMSSMLTVGLGTTTLIVGEALAYLCLRVGHHRAVAAYALFRPILVGTCQIAATWICVESPGRGLIYGAVLGQALALGAYYPVVRSQFSNSTDWRNYNSARTLAEKYAYLTRTQAPQQLMSRIGLNSLPIVLPSAFGATVGGWYVASNRILCTPSQAIGKVFRGVYFSEASGRIRNGQAVLAMYRSTTCWMIALASLYFLPIALFSTYVLRLLFGEDWVEAAPILTALSIFWWSAIVNIPSTALITPLGMDAWYVRYEGWLLSGRLVGILIGILTASPLILVVTFSVIGFLFNLYLVQKVHAALVGIECREN